ncbi:MAG: hypothetical protein JXR10_06870 [Cyclobacteriaceae bacterium]
MISLSTSDRPSEFLCSKAIGNDKQEEVNVHPYEKTIVEGDEADKAEVIMPLPEELHLLKSEQEV